MFSHNAIGLFWLSLDSVLALQAWLCVFSLFTLMSVIALALQVLVSIGLTAGICGILLLCVWRVLHTLRQGASYVKRLHQIPCSQCTYFTGDYRLKCAVHPISALTEDAINCVDYVADSPACGEQMCKAMSACQPLKTLVKS